MHIHLSPPYKSSSLFTTNYYMRNNQMQDLLPLPSCFYSGPKPTSAADPTSAKLGQGVVTSAYRTRIDSIDRTVTVTWCKNLLAHGLSVSIEGSDETSNDENSDAVASYTCHVEMRPWSFWRRHGSKRFRVEGIRPDDVDVFWDLRNAKYSDDPEPLSDYYVAVVHGDEVVLLLGDIKNDAFLRTGSRPSMFDPVLVSKKEHVFGKKRFSTRAKFHDKDRLHAIRVECSSGGGGGNVADSEMVIRIDGEVGMRVKHLQWKFRGNESVLIDKVNVEVYWDVHDWLFSSPAGMRHALFIFKPVDLPPSSSSSSSSSASSRDNGGGNGGGDFCLFLYAWKLE